VAREFTLDEARRTLHEVRSLVVDLQDVQRSLRGVKERLSALDRMHLNNGVVKERDERELRREQRRLAERARVLVTEITSTGAEIKGIDQGLIDFPTTVDGVPSYWCWQAGEDDIAWWHPRATGFAGRRRIEG
jgi:hypothetical protein